jgi:hypothetical protein
MLACNNDETIKKILTSKDKDDIIEGSIKAGKSGEKKFVPMLLNNSDDWRMSTNFNFKGVSVYQAKMEALSKIFKTEPPTKISYKPDSNIISFYTELYKKKSK